MTDITVSIDVDTYLDMASTGALIREIGRRDLKNAEAKYILGLEREVISLADDEPLIDEIEARGFKISKNKAAEDWFEITFKDWHNLAELVASSQPHEALWLIQDLSNGAINAICALNYARIANQQNKLL